MDPQNSTKNTNSKDIARLLWSSHSSMLDVYKSHSAQKAHAELIHKRFKQAQRDKLVPAILYHQNKLSAAILRDKNFGRWVGSPNHQTLTVAVDMQNKFAKQWLTKTLSTMFDLEAEKIFRVVLSNDQLKLIPSLKKIGLQIEDYYLVGKTKVALRSIKAHIETKKLCIPRDIILSNLSTPQQIDQIIRIKRSTFRKYPQFCWFGHFAKYLESEKKELSGLLALSPKKRQKKAKVIVATTPRGKVLGFGSSFFYPKDRLFRSCGGMDYCLSEDIQGYGIGTLITRDLLQALSKNSIPIFTGHTSNPAIIRLGKITERSTEQVFMMRGKV